MTLEEENEWLKAKLKIYESEDTHVRSYLTIKKVIDDINKSMSETDLDFKANEEDDTIKLERAVKIAESLSELNDNLEKLEKKISPQKLGEIKQYGSLLEEAMAKNENK